MGLISLLLFLSIVLVMAALVLVDGEPMGAVVSGLLALVLVIILVFVIAPIELGYSRISNTPESFEKRLKVGVVYEVVATIKPINATDDEKIILVRSWLKDYRAIYVKTSDPIPERFTLINGQPVEVK